MDLKTKERSSSVLYTILIRSKDLGKVSEFSLVEERGLSHVYQELREQWAEGLGDIWAAGGCVTWKTLVFRGSGQNV